MAIVSLFGRGVFEHLLATKDMTTIRDEPPETWTDTTLMNAPFNGNIDAGSLDIVWQQVDGFKIKRRYVGDFEWITLAYYNRSEAGISFAYQDNLVANNKDVQYAIVPIIGGIEQSYVIKDIKTKFNNIYICDATEIYSFSAGVSYGSESRVQKIGVFEPYGRKYPVIVSNGNIGYSTGSMQAIILQDDYLDTHHLDKGAIIAKREALKNFLTNKKAKMLKDWNGNAWLISITGNPTVNYSMNSSMALANISASWTEIGDPSKRDDLINTGIITEVE